jgi:hypothetical protein
MTSLSARERLPWDKIAAISLIKNEVDVIALNLQHLFDCGVRNFAIADNGSTDTTLNVIRQFATEAPTATIFVLNDPIPAHLQSKKITALSAFAASYFRSEWILPFDADDFFWVSPGPRIDLDGLDADFVRLPWLQLHPAFVPLVDLAKLLQEPRLPNVIKSRFPKMLFRYSDNIIVGEGNHGVDHRFGKLLRGVNGADAGLGMAHYPLRTQQQLERKFADGATALEAGKLHQEVGYHWRPGAILAKSTNESGGSLLWSIFMERDATKFSAFCAEHGVDPVSLAYLWEMISKKPETFPRDVAAAIEAVSFRHIYGRQNLTQMSMISRVKYISAIAKSRVAAKLSGTINK